MEQHSATQRQRAKNSVIVALACGLAFLVSIAATLLATLLICAGLHPESLAAMDGTAVLIGLFTGSLWAGSRPGGRGWCRGLAVSLCAIAFWLLAWCYLTSRFETALWWRQGICWLSSRHFIEWSWALLAGLSGAAIGERWRGAGRKLYLISSLTAVLLVPTALWLSQLTSEPSVPLADLTQAGRSEHPAPGLAVRCSQPDGEGTTVRLLDFDFRANPQLQIGLYDADSDDAVPFDNRNTTFLGQSIDFVLDKLRSRERPHHRRLLALFNGGFFGGTSGWVANHEGAVVIDGMPHYNISTIKRKWGEQAWVFGVSAKDGRTRFDLKSTVPWAAMTKFRTAIEGIRPLRVAGRAMPLDAGSGAPGLKCSRTSIGWLADSSRFFVLIVRDPDGEAASIRQRGAHARQSGGWDAFQIEHFWEKMNVPYALLCDSGESTQLCYAQPSGRFTTVRSSYNLSRTLGYWRSRPIRLFIPMLPRPLSQGGVLNYLYVTTPS